MKGIAKSLFEQKRQTPAVPRGIADGVKHWPKLYDWVVEGKLGHADYRLAEILLGSHSKASQEEAAFICYLSYAARCGHLCIVFEGEEVVPKPASLFSEGDDELGFTDEECALWERLVLKGRPCSDSNLLAQALEKPIALKAPIVVKKQNDYQFFYLQRFWLYETLFYHHIQRLSAASPSFSLDKSKMDIAIEGAVSGDRLLLGQADAIRVAASHPVSVVTGGPGTGKSYTAGRLIEMVWQAIGELAHQRFEVVLAAPTGKAAANLYTAVSKAIDDEALLKRFSAQTLHALLSMKKDGTRRSDAPPLLSADFIIVDESSMIDAKMFALLLSAVKEGARLVFLGDAHQLPAVEGGSLFADLIDAKLVPVATLTHCMRTESKAILDLAAAINAGSWEGVKPALHTTESGVKYHPLGKEDFLQRAAKACPPVVIGVDDPVELLHRFSKFRVLTPVRRGPFGVDTLNQKLAELQLEELAPYDRVALPIIVVVNDYKLELYNGDTGIVVCHKSALRNGFFRFTQGDFALFPSTDGSVCRTTPAFLLPKVELAFCLSVHKSQGSEFDEVLLALPDTRQLWGREVLYTAVTRAKKILEVWGSDESLKKTILASSRRVSSLGSPLLEKCCEQSVK